MKQISKQQRINDLEVMNKIASKSKITDRDIEEISKKIKRGATNKFYEHHNNKKTCASQ
jgi:hypothetical protein